MIIKRWLSCVGVLGMDALIWALSLRPVPPHPPRWHEQQRIQQDAEMETRRLIREQEEARAQYLRDQREGRP